MRNGLRLAAVAALSVLAIAAVACNGNDDDDSNGNGNGDDPLTGGILATFAVNDDEFTAWVTKEQTIEDILALEAGESQANIPNGVILRGPGEDDHNAPWSWHLDPEDIEMAEATIEVCDGALDYVEDNVDEFVDQIGRYCPWSAELVSVEDRR